MDLHINPLDTEQKERLESLLSRYRYSPFSNYNGVVQDKVVRNQLIELEKVGAKDKGVLLEAIQNDCLQGIACLEYLPWESGIYDFPMARIPLIMASGDYRETAEIYDGLLEKILRASEDLKYKHLTCRIPVQDGALIHSLEKAGFLLMDTTFEFSWNIRSIKVEEKPNAWIVRFPERTSRILKFNTIVRTFVESDIPDIEALAREAFTERTKTRYSMDPHLPIEKTGDLYVEWFHNSCKGTFADVVMVGADDDGPIGFQTFKLEKDLSEAIGIQIGAMGIGAVLPEKQGRGVFPAILCGMIRWCGENGVNFARGRVLVNNDGMFKSCLGTGAVITSSFHTFHKWLGE